MEHVSFQQSQSSPGEDPALSDQLCSALVRLSSPAREVLGQREMGEPHFPQQSLQFMPEVGGSHPKAGEPTPGRALSPELLVQVLETLWGSSHLAPHLPSLLPSLSKPSCWQLLRPQIPPPAFGDFLLHRNSFTTLQPRSLELLSSHPAPGQPQGLSLAWGGRERLQQGSSIPSRKRRARWDSTWKETRST